MDWYREPGNRAQAVFALNAARLLDHYTELTRGRQEETYDATLTVCVLQALLTNCTELINAMDEHGSGDFGRLIEEESPVWGLRPSLIETNLPWPMALYHVLKHVRNGLSHPLPPEAFEGLLVSGYTAVADQSGKIEAFRITASPWAENGERVGWVKAATRERAEAALKKQTKNLKLAAGFLEIIEGPDGFDLGVDGRIFWPKFSIEVSLTVMVDIAKELSFWLAQPCDRRFRGTKARPVEDLVPA